MPRWLPLLIALLLGGCRPAPQPLAAILPRPAATGPRWVVVKAPNLTCVTCGEQLRADLAQTAGIEQLEVFSPQPYCRFYVSDGQLDVPALLDAIAVHNSALEAYIFVRGG